MSPNYPSRYLFIALLFLLTLIAGAFDPSLSRASSESVRALDVAGVEVGVEAGVVRYPSSAPRLIPKRLPDSVRDLDPANVVDRSAFSDVLRSPVVVPSVTVQRAPQSLIKAWF